MDLSRGELRTWLELVETHFPREPELANDTRQRLICTRLVYAKRLHDRQRNGVQHGRTNILAGG